MQKTYIDTDMVSDADTKPLHGPLTMEVVSTRFREIMRTTMLKRCSFLTGADPERWVLVSDRQSLIEGFESDRSALEVPPVIRDRASLTMIDQTRFRPMALVTQNYERFLIDKTLVQGITEDPVLIEKFLNASVPFKSVVHESIGGVSILVLVCQARSTTYSDYDHLRYDASDEHPVTKSWIYYVMMI